MLFNVKKGPYPSLTQMDTEKLVSADETAVIERGQLLYINDSDEFRIATAANAGTATAPGPLLWFALQASTDLVAGMAGGVPTTGGQPKIAAISIQPEIIVETDMFTGELGVNDWVTVANGGVFGAHTNHNTAYGRVVKAPYSRWVNNAVAVAGWRTGNNVSAIWVKTCYIPNLTTA